MILMLEYLSPDRLRWLWLLPVILLLYLVLLLRGRPTRARSRLDLVLPKDNVWKRNLSVLAALLSLGSLVIAYAQPLALAQVPRERATVVITIDVSRSMMATDIPPNRLESAKEAAITFVELLPAQFNVSLVSFSGTADVVVPPTTDRGLIARTISGLEMAPSTAIGEGIYGSLRALTLAPPDPDNPDDPAPGAIVLMSDGATNMGRDSLEASQAAHDRGVPVYTIAYGTPDGYVMNEGYREPVKVNHRELSDIAKTSGGKKFTAEDSDQLAEVYQAIANSVGYEDVPTEITERFAGIGLGFALVAAIGVISLAARWP